MAVGFGAKCLERRLQVSDRAALDDKLSRTLDYLRKVTSSPARKLDSLSNGSASAPARPLHSHQAPPPTRSGL